MPPVSMSVSELLGPTKANWKLQLVNLMGNCFVNAEARINRELSGTSTLGNTPERGP